MVKIGTGVLSWNRMERVSDRYGAVTLYTSPESEAQPKINKKAEGRKGTLVAVVKETRDSDHIGDMFRGFSPSTPQKGERIVLGKGTLFFERASAGHGGEATGLLPEVERDSDWLDPKALYRAHSQTVDLIFEE